MTFEPVLRHLRVGPVGLTLRATLPPEAVEALDYIVASFRTETGPSEPRLVVELGPDGKYALRCDGEHCARAQEALDLLPFVSRTIHRCFREAETGLLMFHGCMVAREDRLLWLFGEPYSGKSVLALRLLLGGGFTHVADDIAPWDPTIAAALPYRRPLCLRHDVFRLFTAVDDRGFYFPKSGLWYFHPTLDLGGEPMAAYREGVIVHVAHKKGLHRPVSCQPRDSEECSILLRKHLWAATGLEESVVAAEVARIADRFPLYRLFFRDSWEAADCLRGLLS